MIRVRTLRILSITSAFLAASLAGCVAAPPPEQIPLVAIPGPTKTETAFRQDDTACRVQSVQLPQAPPRAAPPSATPPPPAAAVAAYPPGVEVAAYPPGVVYLRCMASRGNSVEPLAAAPVVYGYYPAYPVYAGIGYGFPAYYGPYVGVGNGFYGGYGGYRGYGGGYRGGYGGGYRDGGYRDGGNRDGGFHGGRR